MFVNYVRVHCSVFKMATCIDLTNELSSTIEKTNHARLWRLITDGGNKVLRQVFDSIIPPSSLALCLAKQKNKNTLWYLHTVKHIISNQEWRVLYPRNSRAVTSDDFDITLLMILFRNICKLRQPPTGWDNQPTPHDYSLEADIVRVKMYRNKLAHCSTTNIDKEVFDQWWFEISEALVRLGADRKDIDQLKSESMDRATEQRYLEEMAEFLRTSLLARDLVNCLLEKLANPDPSCREHDRDFESYCTTCGELICEMCKSGEKHQSHEYDLVKEAALTMYNKLKNCEGRLQSKKKNLEKVIEKCLACAESLEIEYCYQEKPFNHSLAIVQMSPMKDEFDTYLSYLMIDK
ncbi:uncharacterized protein [Ptychodera flava]|uniref:uncharacterized protein n=1 Tax=Ptychodera flava TaxID=63121 RepID=UPI00396A65B7